MFFYWREGPRSGPCAGDWRDPSSFESRLERRLLVGSRQVISVSSGRRQSCSPLFCLQVFCFFLFIFFCIFFCVFRLSLLLRSGAQFLVSSFLFYPLYSVFMLLLTFFRRSLFVEAVYTFLIKDRLRFPRKNLLRDSLQDQVPFRLVTVKTDQILLSLILDEEDDRKKSLVPKTRKKNGENSVGFVSWFFNFSPSLSLYIYFFIPTLFYSCSIVEVKKWSVTEKKNPYENYCGFHCGSDGWPQVLGQCAVSWPPHWPSIWEAKKNWKFQ